MKVKWGFALLWSNMAVVALIAILYGANQFSSFKAFLQTALYSVLYTNVVSLLTVFAMSWFLQKQFLRRIPLWTVMAAGMLVFTVIGCLLAQLILLSFGVVLSHSFWDGYLRTLQHALPMVVVFGSGAMVYASLRDRVEKMEQELHEREIAEERMQKQLTEARLRSLESRIHPHFLFNTLNSISSLIAVNPARAEQMVSQLAILLRASLDHSMEPLIPLRQELAMVESYLHIEKVRFGDKLRTRIEVPLEFLDMKTPPMSVQSLVENAVKHGITPKSGGGDVIIRARAENRCLRIEIQDSGDGFDLTAVRPGHGLDTLVSRLNTLFGAEAQLKVFRRDNLSVAEMVLPQQ
jgi:LytS/YehU family sensor histidine kinase